MVDPTGEAEEFRKDQVRYRLVLVAGMTVALVIFSVGSSLEPTLLTLPGNDVPIPVRLLANLAGIAVIGVGTWLTPVYRMSWAARVPALFAVAIAGAIGRAAAQVALGIHPLTDPSAILLDMIAPAVTTTFSVAVGLALAEYQRIVRRQARAGERQALVSASALEALRTEELRVRRDVAEGLHGTVQQQLVMLQTQLARATAKLSIDDPREVEIAQDLAWVGSELNRIREQDVRDLSRLLYPSGIDLGLVQAARILIRQVPPSIEVSTRIDVSVIAADDPAVGGIPVPVRLLAIRVIEEAISNALRHGEAQKLKIALVVDADRVLHIVIDDDGKGVDPGGDPSGLRLLEERLGERGGALSLTGGPLGGARLGAQLPLPA